MAGVLDTAISGLRVSQTALRTIGHNIANASTDGYSRQKVEIGSNPAQLNGPGYIGSGARTTSVERVVDEFMVAQLRSDTSLASQMEAFSENIKQLDTLLSDSATGLSAGLDSFFAVMENVTDDPTSIASRQLVISESESLSLRFNTLYERVDTISDNINQKLNLSVNQINSLAASIADINYSIAGTAGSNAIPNDLLDKREEALRKLSELIAIDVVEQTDGQLNVSIGSGQSLVVGNTARQLGMVDGALNPQVKDIAYQDNTGSQNITNFLTGGEVGGLLEFRGDTLATAYNELGRVAMVMAHTFNEAHSEGVDLNGNYGGLFFNDVNDPMLAITRVFADSSNNGPDDRVMAVELTDPAQLKASDYVMSVAESDTSYRITRASDNTTVYVGVLPSSYPASVEFDGLKLSFVEGSFQEGDRFLIQPTKTGARDILSKLERPDQLALASPLATSYESGNTGNAIISAGAVTSMLAADGSRLPTFATDGEMNPPLIVRFTSETTYDILDNSDPGNPVQLDPPIRNRTFTPGQVNELFTQDQGATLISAEGAALGIGAVTNGALPLAANSNGYLSEIYTFRYTNPETGSTTDTVFTTTAGNSAETLASELSDIAGVSAYARNSAQLSGFDNLSLSVPLQVTLNGEDLIEYEAGALDGAVPDPLNQPVLFNQYLAKHINENANLQGAGIQATAATNTITGRPELRIVALKGQDIDVTLQAQAGETLSVSDYNNSSASLVGAGAGNGSTVTVGGTLDIEMAEGLELMSNPVMSSLLGNSSADDFAKSAFLGIQASINGVANSGDKFYLGFNTDGVYDNRNAIAMVDLSSTKIVDGGLKTYNDSYSTLVEKIGIETNATNINLEASTQVLKQTQSLRDSVSGVNLDEEASDLIKFEQIYNANAQVISVARDLFDRLINSF